MIFESTFNKYEEKEIIGEGGSGRVVKVETENGDLFALKYLKPDNVSSDKIKRFKNELFYCTNVNHKNIIKVIDWGFITFNGKKCPFYVMQYYPHTLRRYIKTKTDDINTLQLILSILNGIEFFHYQTIHRDLKPENILINNTGEEVVISDFGIAHFSQEILETAIETKNQDRLANFVYASPEQRTKGKISIKSDIYSMGLIINELFTGQVPLGQNYIKINEVNVKFGFLDPIIEKMLYQDPAKRFDSVTDIIKEINVRQKDYDLQQEIERLKNTKIQSDAIKDPIYHDPVKLINVDYKNGNLTLILNHKVDNNPQWTNAFRDNKNYSCLVGKEPSRFQFYDKTAVINSSEDEVQKIIDDFKIFLVNANVSYNRNLQHEKELKEKQALVQLKRQIEEEETRKRVLERIKL